jgi:hypothetical protein
LLLRADGGEPAVDRIDEGPAQIQANKQRRFGRHPAGLPVCSMLVMPGYAACREAFASTMVVTRPVLTS